MTMFDVMRRMAYTRRLVDARCRTDRRHCMWPAQDARFVAWRDYFKFVRDRKEHPAYYTRRSVHPRYVWRDHYRTKIYTIREAYYVKSVRKDPPYAKHSKPILS